MTVVHHYVTATEDRNSCLKETFLAEELANVDILCSKRFFVWKEILDHGLKASSTTNLSASLLCNIRFR
jgi:hypothetical protein